MEDIDQVKIELKAKYVERRKALNDGKSLNEKILRWSNHLQRKACLIAAKQVLTQEVAVIREAIDTLKEKERTLKQAKRNSTN